MVDVSDDALPDELVRLLVQGVVVALMTHLEMLARRIGGFDHAAATLDAVGHGLFGENVLSRVERVDGERLVHPEGSRNEDGLDIVMFQELAMIRVGDGVRVVPLLGDFESFFPIGGEDVADRRDPHVAGRGVLHQHSALCTDADDACLHRPHRGGLPEQRPRGWNRGHGLDEIPASQFFLFVVQHTHLHGDRVGSSLAILTARGKSRHGIRPSLHRARNALRLGHILPVCSLRCAWSGGRRNGLGARGTFTTDSYQSRRRFVPDRSTRPPWVSPGATC